ncbi:MAG: DVU_1557 family redox protein [Oscillospiraceae bacterium]
MHDIENLICVKCGVPLKMLPTSFKYVGHTFNAEVPRCPVCGEVFISEELVRGRIHEVETELEDK